MWTLPCKGTGDHQLGSFFKGDHSIHPSERVKLLYNPSTGETREPGRWDRPIHPKYVEAGFTQYKELEHHHEIRAYEKEKGLIHESSHYNQNSVTAERDTHSR